MYGSFEKKNHPISVAEAITEILSKMTKDLKIYPDIKKPFLVKLEGATDLSEPLIQALKDEPELLVILSDGFENTPSAGLAHQILQAYLTKLGKGKKVMILHINPVFAPEAKDIRKLHEKIMSLGIRDVKQLGLILLIALANYKKTAEIEKVLDELRKKVEIPVKKKKVKKNE
jgi:hypothetical protein